MTAADILNTAIVYTIAFSIRRIAIGAATAILTTIARGTIFTGSTGKMFFTSADRSPRGIITSAMATANILLATGLVGAAPIACGDVTLGTACAIRTAVSCIANKRAIETAGVCKITLTLTSFARIHNTVTAGGTQTG
jgi:hypothetical protein